MNPTKQPPWNTFKFPTCKGTFFLGTACGSCEKCDWELKQLSPSDLNRPPAVCQSVSLRTQIIDAIRDYFDGAPRVSPELLFDNSIMPILQKAMDAGQLLVGRNTGERIPVPTAVINWITGMGRFRDTLKENEGTISRRLLLTMVYQLGDDADRALRDIENLNKETH